ncbi:MAG: hemolysin family protein [Desulfobacterales bacterium]|nr:hemolysin family protein [Desulfobacterales bacterium]
MEDDSEKGFFSLIKTLIKKKPPLGDSSDLAEEIHDLMDEGQAKGLISDEETHMVNGVLDLKETRAHSIMIPRTEISSAPANSTLGEVIRLVTDCGHTRIPIHNDNIDEIVGILHAKDLLKFLGEPPTSEIPLEILRKPYFVPGTQMISKLLKDLKEKKNHLAILTDEYGGTAGIITIEDILEEIVGEIMDEHDPDKPLLTAIDEKSILVDARLEVEKLEEHLDIRLPAGDFESVGGFVIHLLGRIPEANEKVPFENFTITVQEADQRKIEKILITRNPPSVSPEEEKAQD